MNEEKYLCLSKPELLEVLSVLETMVVSLDRIGSVEAASGRLQPEITRRFLQDFDVFRELAKARSVLWKALDAQKDRAEIEVLEQSLETLPKWNSTQ